MVRWTLPLKLKHRSVRPSHLHQPSFLLIDYVLNIPDSPDGRVIRIYESYDPDCLTKVTGILIRDKKLVDEVRHAMTVGFSHHGLGFKVSKNSLDILINDNNPSNPKSTTHAFIYLLYPHVSESKAWP